MGCGSGQIKQTDPSTIPGGPDGVKGSIKNEVRTTEGDADSSEINKLQSANKLVSTPGGIVTIMNFLASDELQGRDTGSEGIAKAAEFIEEVFKKNNIKPFFKSYKDTLSNFDAMAYNVVGVIEGSDPKLKNEFILIGAHYDHLGIRNEVYGDTIANGANDNASGTSIVLELARHIGNIKPYKRSLIFALFSAEEQGLLGSKHLAKKLKEQKVNLYTMLNFEMVGVPLVEKDYFVYATGYELSNIAEVCNTYAKENLVGFLPQAKEFGLFTRSDNYPFHNELEVPSHTFCTFDFTNFDHYHKVGDEASLMDFKHMTTLVNKFIPVIEGIANANQNEIEFK